jgi:S-DNA-T family DNA segregation ATPase FtsK/SpoIIIE
VSTPDPDESRSDLMLPDVERHVVEPGMLGGPVDPPAEPRTLYGTIMSSRQVERPPIVPAWMRNADQRVEVARQAADLAGYLTALRVTRAPKYATKTLVWSIPGIWVALRLTWAWLFDREAHPLRSEAIRRNQPADYQALSRQRDRRIRRRAWGLGIVMVLLCGGTGLVYRLAPAWVQVLVVASVVVVLARIGAHAAGKPIVDRVEIGPRFVRLTAEQVREAVMACGIGVKGPESIRFPPPGVHRDGPGWLARFDLPAGLRAVKLLEARESLSSALRLPVDQIWPSVGPDHAGQVDLWVGMQPASKMGRAKWALASPTAQTSVFEPFPFGHDERLRAINVVFFQRNFLIGGQPGAGKTGGGRSLVLGALLDPTVEIWLAAFKPAEDFYDVSEFCSRYVCGIDDATMEEAERMVADGLREVQRRQTLLGKLKRAGKIAEGKTSPELAAAGIGLHGLIIVLDETHELFLWSKSAADALIRLVKQGRSAGVMVVLLTQVAGKDSVPPELTRCVSSRWCMSVLDQVANDQIMGTGAYKKGRTGTAFRPEVDAGWGVTDGMAGLYRGPARAYWPDEKELAVMLDRIRTLRGGGSPTTAMPDAPTRDILADVRSVLRASESGLPWEVVAERLAESWPEAYSGITAEMVRTALDRWGVPSLDVKWLTGDKRSNLKGLRRTALDEAQRRREIESE